MTKLLIQPLDIDSIKDLNKLDINGYIIGLKNYSIFQSFKLDIEEIKKLDVNSKELYISINKPIHNSEINSIRNILVELSKLNINGILFEDIAIYNINKNMGLGINLIWNQMHLPTNYETCNYWNKKGVIGAVLSTELMLEDFINIKKNTNMLIMVNIYGHMPIFESSRVLITNYLKYINKEKTDDLYYLYEKERDKYYPIYEEYDNTFILDETMNGINVVKDIVDNNIDYIILNGLLDDKEEFNKVINEYIDTLKGKYIKKENVYTGFLFKESIFRVKE